MSPTWIADRDGCKMAVCFLWWCQKVCWLHHKHYFVVLMNHKYCFEEFTQTHLMRELMALSLYLHLRLDLFLYYNDSRCNFDWFATNSMRIVNNDIWGGRVCSHRTFSFTHPIGRRPFWDGTKDSIPFMIERNLTMHCTSRRGPNDPPASPAATATASDYRPEPSQVADENASYSDCGRWRWSSTVPAVFVLPVWVPHRLGLHKLLSVAWERSPVTGPEIATWPTQAATINGNYAGSGSDVPATGHASNVAQGWRGERNSSFFFFYIVLVQRGIADPTTNLFS